MAGWDDVPDASAKPAPTAKGWDAVPDVKAPSPDFQPTKYGFSVKDAVTPDTGKPTKQSKEGFLWYGPEQGNPNPQGGWFNDKGQQVQPAKDASVGKAAMQAVLNAPMFGTSPVSVDQFVPAGLNTDKSERAPTVGRAALGAVKTVLAPVQWVANKTVGGDTMNQVANNVRDWADENMAPSAGGEMAGAAAIASPLPLGQASEAVRTLLSAYKAGRAAVPLANLLVGTGAGATLAPAMTLETDVKDQADFDARKKAEAKLGAKFGLATSTALEAIPLLARGVNAVKSAWGSRAVAAAPGVEAIAPEVVGKTARKAAGGGFGSTAAKTELAEMTQLNAADKARADRLGMELPADVLSDNPQVRAAAGLTRSVASSEPEAAWQTTIKKAADRSDQLMQEADAHFQAGTTSPASVSDKVNKALLAERDAIAKRASEAYGAVDASVPKETTVQMDKLGSTLADIEREVGSGGMTKQESRLAAMLADPENLPTYGRLIREKNLIGQAISGRPSPYGDLDTASLKRLYSALSEDQLANVGAIAGEEARAQLHGANLLYAKQKGLESRIVGAFGKENEKAISGMMQQAITQSVKGDSKSFNNLLKTVPDDLQKETLTTALANATRSNRGTDKGAFGFNEFAKTWQGIKANTPVYDRMQKVLGPDTVAMLDDLQVISQRLTESRANVLTTGKANQALVSTMAKQTAFGNLLESTGAHAASTAAGAAGGGPAGAVVSNLIHRAMSKMGRDPLRATGNLFNSPEFMQLVEKVSAGTPPSGAAVESVVVSPRFQAFAAHVKGMPKGVANQAAWLTSRLAATPTLPKAAGEGTPDTARK